MVYKDIHIEAESPSAVTKYQDNAYNIKRMLNKCKS